MKTKLTTWLLSASLLLVSFTMQGGIDEVIGALKAGNVSELSRYIEDNVEITLPDKSDNYSKAQAGLVLKDFFSNSGVKSFDLKHKG
ncbi:MAG: hypothetical protein JWM28_2298, partial [Chitinophagaceae bacterium]|nr:hypothetical protein [Chitinophagaceae bacterium]